MQDNQKIHSHHSGFGAGIVLGLLGGLFAYFLYDTPEGQDLKRRFKTELDRMKAEHNSVPTPAVPSTSPSEFPDQKPTSFMGKISQLFSNSSENTSKKSEKPKKSKKDPSRRYFIRKSN
jgi:hypothetical protein